MTIQVHPDWWKTLFDDMYLKTDARSVCDGEISGREVDLICELLPLDSEHSILDLCGGQGRHSLELWRRGFTRCTVVDYSRHLIDQGKRTAQKEKSGVRFLRGDARQTGLAEGSFNHVIIMGNSLGYLPEKRDDRRILAEANRLLKPGSTILIDVTDGEKVAAEFTSNSWHEVDEDLVVCRQRRLDNGRVKAREMVFSRREGLLRDQAYAIRIYRCGELEELVLNAGFVNVRTHKFSPHKAKGDYGFMNRRIIVTAVKPRG